MQRLIFLLLLGFNVNVLVGCATTTCDPTQGGLLGGIKLVTTDCGQERIDEKYRHLDATEYEVSTLEAENEKLALDKQEAQQKVLILEAEIEQLDRKAKLLQAKAASYQAATEKAKKDKAYIQNRIKELNSKIAQAKQQLSTQTTVQSQNQYQEQIKKLKAEIDELWQTYYALK